VGYGVGIGGVVFLTLIAQFGFAKPNDDKASAILRFANGRDGWVWAAALCGLQRSYESYKSSAKNAQIAAIVLGLGGAALPAVDANADKSSGHGLLCGVHELRSFGRIPSSYRARPDSTASQWRPAH
jgi:hypothetical protein